MGAVVQLTGIPSPGAGPPRHLLHIFPTFGVGGVQVRISTILNHLGRRYRHTIAALDGDTSCRNRLDDRLEAALICPRNVRTRPLSAFGEIRRVLAAERPDLVLTYNWGAIEWALVNRFTRSAGHIHLESGFGIEEAKRQIRRRVWLRRLALARTHRIVVPSHTLIDIARNIWRIAPEKLLLIPNGVDCEKFACPPQPGLIPGFDEASGDLIVGIVAPLRSEKNIARLIRAFSDIAGRFPARLLIVGEGPERPGLEALAAARGMTERIVFAGHIDAPERVLGWMDVFALSSDTEQMPNALIQAMAAGRPIAGIDVGDVARIVAPANRPFIARPDDEDGFRNAMAALLENASLRAEIGARNREHVRAHYTQEQMFEAYDKLFAV